MKRVRKYQRLCSDCETENDVRDLGVDFVCGPCVRCRQMCVNAAYRPDLKPRDGVRVVFGEYDERQVLLPSGPPDPDMSEVIAG